MGLLRVLLRPLPLAGERLVLVLAMDERLVLRLVELRVTGDATAVGLRVLRLVEVLRIGLLRLPFLAARTLAIMALAAAEPLAGRPLRLGEVLVERLVRRALEREVGESNLTILFIQIK